MIKTIDVVINYIDKNYHKELTNEDIKKITGYSYVHFRTKFKEIVGIPLDEYRRRRQLTLILQEIIRTGSSINKSNLSPWKTDNSFRKAFKSEFKQLPYEAMRTFREELFQERFDTSVDVAIVELLKKHKNPGKALEFLLKLKPLIYTRFSFISKFDIDEEIDLIIMENFDRTSKDQYQIEAHKIKTFYDLDNPFVSTNLMVIKGFILAKRKLINKIYKKHMPCLQFPLSSIRTVWSASSEIIKVRKENYNKSNENKIITMPYDLRKNTGSLSKMHNAILRELIIQDCGGIVYESYEQLALRVKFDYDRPIDNNLCENCNYLSENSENECSYGNEEDCIEIEKMTEAQKQEYYLMPDYEPLNVEVLISHIHELLLKGMLYLENE